MNQSSSRLAQTEGSVLHHEQPLAPYTLLILLEPLQFLLEPLQICKDTNPATLAVDLAMIGMRQRFKLFPIHVLIDGDLFPFRLLIFEAVGKTIGV